MNELEKIIQRASCPCRDEECQRELAHVRRAVREALEMAAHRLDKADRDGTFVYPLEAAGIVRALAATLDKNECVKYGACMGDGPACEKTCKEYGGPVPYTLDKGEKP